MRDEKVISDQLSVGGQMTCSVFTCLPVYVFTRPDEALDDGDEDKDGEDGK